MGGSCSILSKVMRSRVGWALPTKIMVYIWYIYGIYMVECHRRLPNLSGWMHYLPGALPFIGLPGAAIHFKIEDEGITPYAGLIKQPC